MSLIPDTKPRFTGCPPICETANLPMFEVESDAMKWHNANAPGITVNKIVPCGNHFHLDTTARGPSGESSGHGRAAKHKQKP